VPAHKALQQRRFVPFAETTIGKPSVVRDEELFGSDLHKAMLKTWSSYWTKAVGQKETKKKKKKKK
jgi:hypothetical protein